MTRRRAAAAGLVLVAASLAHAGDARLEVKLAGVRHGQGTLRVALYRDTATFCKDGEAVLLADTPAALGQRSVHMAGLEPGRYAVLAWHDEDDDGRLDRLLGLFPSEGWGLSNNPEVSGAPAFADCAFELHPGDNAQIIELHY